VLRHNDSHYARVGHTLEIRARETFILYTLVDDRGSGTCVQADSATCSALQQSVIGGGYFVCRQAAAGRDQSASPATTLIDAVNFADRLRVESIGINVGSQGAVAGSI
jgi:hypothetical protein